MVTLAAGGTNQQRETLQKEENGCRQERSKERNLLLSLPNSSRTSLIKAMTKKDKKSQPVTAEETRHSPDNSHPRSRQPVLLRFDKCPGTGAIRQDRSPRATHFLMEAAGLSSIPMPADACVFGKSNMP